MTGVQLIGKEAVINRFEKFDTDAWALYQGKQFIVSGIGAESLSEWLGDLGSAGSTATYTLRVYEGDAPTSATAGGDYIASLNFKLVDMYEGYGIAGHTTRLMQRIEGIEKKLAETEQDEGESENISDVVMGWLKDPQQLGAVVGVIRQAMGMPTALPAPGQTVAGFNVTSDANTGGGEQRLVRLAGALDALEKGDPQLVEHLEKLAKLATNDPLIFKAIISKLDGL